MSEEIEMEREMVPIADRCYRGCGERAVVWDGFSAFCAKCSLTMLKSGDTRLSVVAA